MCVLVRRCHTGRAGRRRPDARWNVPELVHLRVQPRLHHALGRRRELVRGDEDGLCGAACWAAVELLLLIRREGGGSSFFFFGGGGTRLRRCVVGMGLPDFFFFSYIYILCFVYKLKESLSLSLSWGGGFFIIIYFSHGGFLSFFLSGVFFGRVLLWAQLAGAE